LNPDHDVAPFIVPGSWFEHSWISMS